MTANLTFAAALFDSERKYRSCRSFHFEPTAWPASIANDPQESAVKILVNLKNHRDTLSASGRKSISSGFPSVPFVPFFREGDQSTREWASSRSPVSFPLCFLRVLLSRAFCFQRSGNPHGSGIFESVRVSFQRIFRS